MILQSSLYEKAIYVSRSKCLSSFDSNFFFSNIETNIIKIYIPTFTPGLQSARETLMVESAQSRGVADAVCHTQGHPHPVTENQTQINSSLTFLLYCLHMILYIHTQLEQSKEHGHDLS